MSGSLQVPAAAGLLIATIDFCSELSQCVAFHAHGWLGEYFADLGNIVDWTRVAGDTSSFVILLARPDIASDSQTFRVFLAILSFYKWIKLLYALTPFRVVGLQILPILHALAATGPFYTVLIVHIAGLWHAHMSLEPGGMGKFTGWTLVYQMGLIGEVQAEDLTNSEPDTPYYYAARVLFMLVSLFITVTLMNVFIAD